VPSGIIGRTFGDIASFFRSWPGAVRYKQTVIGAAWALIRPFLTNAVFTVIFGKLANLPSEGSPHGFRRDAALDLLRYLPV
jgi:hypothetical protein